MRKLALLLLVFVAGCTTPLYRSPDGVSIHLRGEPTVEKDYYEIQFRFESPTDDPHLIQWIELNGWTGVEAFTVLMDGKTSIDTHHPGRGTTKQYRRITIAPGKVEGTDQTFWGFSMLPSEWPEGFNDHYRKWREIRGRVAYRLPARATIYRLEFEEGKLVWYVEGTDVRREWYAVDTPSK